MMLSRDLANRNQKGLLLFHQSLREYNVLLSTNARCQKLMNIKGYRRGECMYAPTVRESIIGMIVWDNAFQKTKPYQGCNPLLAVRVAENWVDCYITESQRML